MTGVESLIAGVIGVGKTALKTNALKKVLESVSKSASAKTQKSLRKFLNEKEIAHLYTQLSKVRKVKTLGQIDKAVDLMTFYCPSHVLIEARRKKILTIDDFGTKENLVVEGIAGQGKSMLLRYLCGVELLRGGFIPVFVELRNIREKQTLISHILTVLKSFKLDVDEEIFSDLCNSGRILLLLDGFDEVYDDDKQKMLGQIDHLAKNHEYLRIIVSSRPNSGIAACSHFRVVVLSDLEGGEFEHVIYKLLDDSAIANVLIKQVKQHKGGIAELLLTPLLVTLLVIRYKSYQELPEQLSDFYDSLFQLLLQRHDGVKLGYKRPRKCAMNDFQYRQVFEALCFISKKQKDKRYDYQNIYKISDQALADKQIHDDPDKFLDDIVKITCLLVKDGEEYRFIHKSVQEYYAASYIKQKPDLVIQGLYTKLFSPEYSVRYAQEMSFLAEIDSYRYHKFGVLAFLCKMFGCSETMFLEDPLPKYVAIIKKELLSLVMGCEKENGFYRFSTFFGPRLPVNVPSADMRQFLEMLRKLTFIKFQTLPVEEPRPVETFFCRGITPKVSNTLGALLMISPSSEIDAFLNNKAQEIAKDLFNIGRKSSLFVKRAEDVGEAFGLE